MDLDRLEANFRKPATESLPSSVRPKNKKIIRFIDAIRAKCIDYEDKKDTRTFKFQIRDLPINSSFIIEQEGKSRNAFIMIGDFYALFQHANFTIPEGSKPLDNIPFFESFMSTPVRNFIETLGPLSEIAQIFLADLFKSNGLVYVKREKNQTHTIHVLFTSPDSEMTYFSTGLLENQNSCPLTNYNHILSLNPFSMEPKESPSPSLSLSKVIVDCPEEKKPKLPSGDSWWDSAFGLSQFEWKVPE